MTRSNKENDTFLKFSNEILFLGEQYLDKTVVTLKLAFSNFARLVHEPFRGKGGELER